MTRPTYDVKFTVNAAFFREIKEDHRQLQILLERLRHLASVPPALPNHYREFCDLLCDLQDQLAFHFALEEAYGYFEDAVERAPRFHEVAGRLRSEHSQLYLAVQALVEAATRTTAVEAASLAEAFTRFDGLLKTHEAAELRLILDALQLDVGVGD